MGHIILKKIALIHEQKKQHLSNEYEKDTLLTRAESIAIRTETQLEKVKFSESMKTKDEQIAAERKVSQELAGKLAPFEKRQTGLHFLFGQYGTGEKVRDVTETLNNLTKEGSINIKVENGNFGDPAPGLDKKLTAIYMVNGAYKYIEKQQGHELSIHAITPLTQDDLNSLLP